MGSLGAGDLELLATAAYMLGRDEENVGALERAHHASLDAGEALRATRNAFWRGLHFALRGELGQGFGGRRPQPQFWPVHTYMK
jgi:hypothetical protein